MLTDLFYATYFIFAITIIGLIIFWNSNLHKSHKFNVLLSALTASCTLFMAFTIIAQLYGTYVVQDDTEITLYETLFNQLIADTITFFESNPDMNYYYDEIFQPLHYKENCKKQKIKRNYTKEQQATQLILQRTATIIYYINSDKELTGAQRIDVQTKLKGFMGVIIKSKIFVENYNNVKDKIISNILSQYMQENFNI